MVARELVGALCSVHDRARVAGVGNHHMGRRDDGADGRASTGIVLVDKFILEFQGLVQIQKRGVDGGLGGGRGEGRARSGERGVSSVPRNGSGSLVWSPSFDEKQVRGRRQRAPFGTVSNVQPRRGNRKNRRRSLLTVGPNRSDRAV